MIIGHLSAALEPPAILPAAIVRARDVLKVLDLTTLEFGRYEVEGDQLFYLIEDVTSRNFEDCSAKAHRSYADI